MKPDEPSKCAACRRGIYPFVNKHDTLYHMDTRGNVLHPCTNPDFVIPYLEIDDETNAIIGASPHLVEMLRTQSLWWGDILILANITFSDSTEFDKFFKHSRDAAWSDIEFERELCKLAQVRNISVTVDEYPSLFQFNIEQV